MTGHWNHEKKNFTFDVEKERFSTKPMKCLGHYKIFTHSDKLYRDLPFRMADLAFCILDFIEAIFGFFGFSYTLELSTRPEKFLGEIETWKKVEDKLMRIIEQIYSAREPRRQNILRSQD
jgi:threonyl-tRNA synthetase